jgi:PAS domain S-box-containing protein
LEFAFYPLSLPEFGMAYFLLVLAILFRAVTAVLALRLIPVSGRKTAWILIALGFTLSTLRLLVDLGLALFWDFELSVVEEALTLGVSVLTMVGVFLIRQLFIDFRDAARDRERLLNEDRAYLRHVYQAIASAIIIIDSRGIQIEANRAAAEIIRLPVEKIIGRDFRAWCVHMIREDGTPLPEEEFPVTRVLRTGKTVHNSLLGLLRPDHSRRWILVNAAPLGKPGEDRVQEVVTTFIDVTERKQAEAALAESEARFRALFENSHAVMLLIDPDSGRIMGANAAACSFYSYARAQLLAMNIGDLNVLSKEEIFRKMDGARAATSSRFEFQHRLANGEMRDVEVYSGPVPVGGRPLLFSIIHDISLRRQAESEREKLLAELEATIQSMADGVVILNPAGEFLRMNPVAEELLGVSIDAGWSGKSDLPELRMETSTGAALSLEEWPIRRALRGEMVTSSLLVLRRSGQRPRWLSVSAAPIRNQQGDRLGAVAVFTDISVIHGLQQQRENLLHTISHDLRIPLTVVQGHAELLRDYLKEAGDDNAKVSIEAILQASERVNTMIEELVDMSRIEGGTLVLKRQPVDLPDIVRKLLLFSAEALEAGRIETDFPPDLPPLSADPHRLERILTNLLTNALKFSPQDSTVRIKARPSGNEVIFAVLDQGIGIDSADLPYIFDRFYRPRRREGQGDSVGLGLYITRMLVEAHGGRIWVESTPGSGSKFFVALPAA